MSTYKLNYPVEWDGQTVTEIKFSRPKGKHIKKLGASADLEQLVGIAHHISDYTDGFFEDLDASDYLGVSDVIGGFLDNGQAIG